MRKHRHVAGGNGDRSSLHRRRFGLLKLRRNSTVVARNHAPRWLRLPRGGRDCGPKNGCCCGSLRRRQYLLLLVCQILGEIFCDSLGVTVRKPSASARTSLPSGVGGKGFVTEATDSPSDGASAATYTNPTTFGSFPASVITTPP